MKIKITDNDPHGFKKSKFLIFSCLILGILLVLLGGTGFVIDLFFPAFSDSYHRIAGDSNAPRFFLGALSLICFYILRK